MKKTKKVKRKKEGGTFICLFSIREKETKFSMRKRKKILSNKIQENTQRNKELDISEIKKKGIAEKKKEEKKRAVLRFGIILNKTVHSGGIKVFFSSAL